MANSSFSSVVSGLVRAQMGSSIPSNTVDEELDRRVAELILKEARQKEAKYGRTGSYSPQTGGNAVKTNKRFLSSIIKSTDEHNKTILRAQAEAALEIKQQREREEREERMRRAEEAAAARIGSSSSPWISRDERSHRKRSSSRERRERHYSSRHEQKRDRSPVSEADSHRKDSRRKRRRYDEESNERRSASPPRHRDEEEASKGSNGRHKSSRREHDRDERRRDRRRSRSRSPRRGEHSSDRKKSRRDGSPRVEKDKDLDRHKDRRRSSLPRKSREESRRPHADEPSMADVEMLGREEQDQEEEALIGPRPTLPGTVTKEISSKMDKYFAEDYDPRLDVTPALASKDGLIPPEAFENWDMMLEIVRVRREEKEERKRLEKLHRSGSSSKSKVIASALPKAEAEDLLSIQYTKKGGVREWDEGKKVT